IPGKGGGLGLEIIGDSAIAGNAGSGRSQRFTAPLAAFSWPGQAKPATAPSPSPVVSYRTSAASAGRGDAQRTSAAAAAIVGHAPISGAVDNLPYYGAGSSSADGAPPAAVGGSSASADPYGGISGSANDPNGQKSASSGS